MANKICCKKGFSEGEFICCEYNSAFFCKNPDCEFPILTSTCYGARPSGCPMIDKWNSKKANLQKNKERY